MSGNKTIREAIGRISGLSQGFLINTYKRDFQIKEAKYVFQECLKEIIGEDYLWPKEYDQIVSWLKDTKGKGLLLIGPIGTGKSVIITKVIPVIAELFYPDIKGVPIFSAYDLNTKAKDVLYYQYWLAIDDVGIESERVDYGNHSMVFNEVVDKAERVGTMLFLSSNLTIGELGEKYGERTMDRLKDLVRVVVLKGKSMRGRK